MSASLGASAMSKDADTPAFAAGERSGEQNEALLGECGHEGGMVAAPGCSKAPFRGSRQIRHCG